jgi:hypothetical protein
MIPQAIHGLQVRTPPSHVAMLRCGACAGGIDEGVHAARMMIFPFHAQAILFSLVKLLIHI